MKIEDKIAESRNMKDAAVQFWIIAAVVSGIMAAIAFLMNNLNYLGTSYGLFMITSIAAIAWFTIYNREEEDLMNELEKQNLEERIEELEQSL